MHVAAIIGAGTAPVPTGRGGRRTADPVFLADDSGVNRSARERIFKI